MSPIPVFAVLAFVAATTRAAPPIALPDGVNIDMSNGQFRLNAEYSAVETWGPDSLEYQLRASVPLGDAVALATNGARARAGGGYQADLKLGYIRGDRGAASRRTLSTLGVAGEPAAGASPQHSYLHLDLIGSADYDRHDVVSKAEVDWTTQSPKAMNDYRLSVGGALIGRFEWANFAMAVSAFGKAAWSHEFVVSEEEVCAPVTAGSEVTSCRTLPTTDRLPSGLTLVGEAGGNLTLLFYGPAAIGAAGRANPGMDLGFKMSFGDIAPEIADDRATRLTVGAFVTPDFGFVSSAVYFRTGIWVDIPVEGYVDETLSFSVQMGATY